MTDTAIVADMGRRIKTTRVKKKFTQADVAERSGLSVFTISQIENGKNVSLITLISVMRVLKLLENLENLVPEPVASPVELFNKLNKRTKSKK